MKVLGMNGSTWMAQGLSNSVRALLVTLLMLAAAPASADLARIKELGHFGASRDNALVGYGLVTGLAGTGDSPRNRATRQSLANALDRFGVTVPIDDISSRNTAAVFVSASLPAFGRPGEQVDVTVTSIGDARSLVGGVLLLTPLKGADDRIYALSQGPISVGGYRYDMNGNVVQKNHPNVASIPGGGTIEVPAPGELASDRVVFTLNERDYTTASRIAAAIGGAMPGYDAQVRDASSIEIAMPTNGARRLPEFIAAVENLTITPDARARVVINERTGTVVSGGDVSISKVAIAHGDIKVSIVTDNLVSQPYFVGNAGRGIVTQPYSNSRVSVEEGANVAVVNSSGSRVEDLVQALARMKINTRDIISILRAMKAAGALRAELVVQ